MARPTKKLTDLTLLAAALEGLQLQKSRIEEQIRQVRELLGGGKAKVSAPVQPAEKAAGRRPLSPAARRRIAQAQKRRWADYRKKAAAAKQAEK
jgi:hypothetical protein